LIFHNYDDEKIKKKHEEERNSPYFVEAALAYPEHEEKMENDDEKEDEATECAVRLHMDWTGEHNVEQKVRQAGLECGVKDCAAEQEVDHHGEVPASAQQDAEDEVDVERGHDDDPCDERRKAEGAPERRGEAGGGPA